MLEKTKGEALKEKELRKIEKYLNRVSKTTEPVQQESTSESLQSQIIQHELQPITSDDPAEIFESLKRRYESNRQLVVELDNLHQETSERIQIIEATLKQRQDERRREYELQRQQRPIPGYDAQSRQLHPTVALLVDLSEAEINAQYYVQDAEDNVRTFGRVVKVTNDAIYL